MNKNASFQELIETTRRVINKFKKKEQRSWGSEVMVVELTKQVGELAKHVLTFEKYYIKRRSKENYYKTSKKQIADELADILYSLIRIADFYNIDLEKAHLKARKEEINYLKK